MARWRWVFCISAAAVFVVPPLVGAGAEEMTQPDGLLWLGGPKVDVTVLAQESMHGQGLPPLDLLSGPTEFGVILWDEVKPGQPSPKAPAPSSAGQGHSNVNGQLR